MLKNYTVIITSDHGGGGGYGRNSHGSSSPEDMTIPFFIMGDGFEKGKQLEGISIIDVAPTIAVLLGVSVENDWMGKSIC